MNYLARTGKIYRFIVRSIHLQIRKERMKVKNSLQADPKKGDILVKRKGRLYRINKRNPRRKARQG